MLSSLPLRIHCWGGFGSQLNALAFALEIKTLIGKRQIEIVFHSGGVTRRFPEIINLLPPEFKHVFVDDFTVHAANTAKPQFPKRQTSQFLEKLGFILREPITVLPKKIKPWLFSCRGHYSYVSFSKGTLASIMKLLDIDLSKRNDNLRMVHFRLGDLLTLEKAHVSPDDLYSLLSSISRGPWVIFSDSPEESKKFLQDVSFANISATFKRGDPATIIKTGLEAGCFVGTTSKLSIWISILRTCSELDQTFLPKSMSASLQNNTNSEFRKAISFY